MAKKRTIQNIEVTENYTDLETTKTVLNEKIYEIKTKIDELSKSFNEKYNKWYEKINKKVKEMNKHFCQYLDNNNSNYHHGKDIKLGSITLDPSVCDIPSNPSYKF